MKIRYINGNRLYYAFLAGGNAVIRDQEYLNKINVFPIPDADTGTNLASTMRSIAEDSTAHRSLKTTLLSIANAALSGARGNSGIIFAQFVHGISEEIGHETKLSTLSFGESVKRAVQYAYRAILSPVEGTMLTVIREWAEDVYKKRDRTNDFVDLLSGSLKTAKKSLKETPKKLSVLARAGVVDAGAKGFVDFLEGILHFIRKGTLDSLPLIDIPRVHPEGHVHLSNSIPEYRYCSEALLTGRRMHLDQIQDDLRQHGDSIIVAGSKEKARIHVHTNRPADLFLRLKNYGSIVQIKVDDMRKQYEAACLRKSKIAIVTDSTCDLPQEVIDERQIHIIPIPLTFGNTTFLDRVTIMPEQFYSLLETSREHPKSAQPDLKSLENLYSFLADHYDSLIVITLSAELSGFHGLCQKAAEKIENKKVSVINSKNISATLGFLVLRASDMALAGRRHEEIVEAIQGEILKTRLYVDIRTLKYMVRGGRVSALKGWAARLINLKPIVSLDAEGRVILSGKSFSRSRNMKKINAIIRKISTGEGIENYAIVHAHNPERARAYAEYLTDFLQQKPAYIQEISPVIGVHNGIGAVAVALIVR
ncbi:MAG: DegV family protein [Candidatus Aminicenantales bacterium]